MPKIKSITCHKLVNSRGDWTIGTKVTLTDGSVGVQTIPDGASKGEHEAYYIPVEHATQVVSTVLNDALVGEKAYDQEKVERIMLEMDGTPNKQHLGGNSILSVSLALTKAVAVSKNIELYEQIAELFGNKKLLEKDKAPKFPTPVFNVINGGKHAHNGLSFQEFMIIPSPKIHYKHALEIGVELYHTLKGKLEQDGFETDVGDEGGFAPLGFTPDKALHYLREAVKEKYTPGKDIFFGMDVAAESFYKDGKYMIEEENLSLTSSELSDYYHNLMKKYELIYLEDPFYERDHAGWAEFYKKFHKSLMVVGDDLVVTNSKFLRKAIDEKLANAVIVKPNQVGTLSETLEFIKMAQKNKMSICVSHRSGDTAEDTFIADLAVAVGADFMKSGAPARGERVAKYNRLLEIWDKVHQ